MSLRGDDWPPPPRFDHAACRHPDVDLGWFFPERGEPIGRAIAICNTCEDLEACRQWSLDAGPTLVGIFGGLTQLGRRRARRQAIEPVAVVVHDVTMTDIELVPAQSTNGNEPVAIDTQPVSVDSPSCVECNGPIPADRARQRAVTCSADCYRTYNRKRAKQRRTAKPATVTRDTGQVYNPGSLVDVIRTLTTAGLTVALTVDGTPLTVHA